MKYKLQDLIDMEQFQSLQDRLNEIYSFPSAIIDNEGNILTATAWQDICTQFHRKNKDCERDCIHSDQYILSHLHEANPAISYRCPRGLVDNATPIIIDGIHYGNFFTGQFFLEKPDIEFFKAQAKTFGFDEAAYLEAVKRVPVWSQEQLNNYLFFIKGLIAIISESGLKQLKGIETRKQIEESEERTNTIFRQMNDGFWITNPQGGQIVDANEAICRMLGYTRDDLLKMSVADVEANDPPEVIARRIQHIIQTGSTQFESRFRRKDGTIFDVEVSVTYLPKQNLFFGFHRDISERKRSEEALRESETRFRTLFEQAAVSVALLETKTGRFIRINQRYCDFLGYTQEEMLNLSFQAVTFPDDVQENVDNNALLLAGKIREFSIEKRYIRKDGSIVWGNLTASPLWAPGEKPVVHLHIAVVQDITERKRSEEALRKSEEQYRLLTENIKDVVWILDTETMYFRYVSPSVEKLRGYTPEEILAEPVTHALTAEAIENVIQLTHRRVEDVLSGKEPPGKFYTEEVEQPCKDGSTVWTEVITSYYINPEKGRVEVRGVTRDITERKKTEEKIQADQIELKRLLAETERSRRALLSVVEDRKEAEEQIQQLNAELEQRVKERTAQLEAVNHELEAFAYSVSHDLRAPLRAMDGFSAILLDDYLDQLDVEGQRYLTRIQEASWRMGQLIEDLLNLSRITRREINLSRVDLSSIAQQIADELQAQSPDRRVEFEISPHLITRADANLMKIALENLLRNAFKFTNRRELACIQVGMIEQGRTPTYYVRDNGAGFDMTYAGKLFTPFQRLHGASEYPGTGIGLTIVQRIVARHGGRIWAEATEDQGATFYFTLGGT